MEASSERLKAATLPKLQQFEDLRSGKINMYELF
jgi:hypothetical protein